MRGTKTLSKAAPQIPTYVKELAENEYAQENLRRGYESLREGARALADQREHPKRHWPKRLAIIGVAGAAAAGAAIAAKGAGSGEAQK
ncbi:MAG TPA: hypothetical protein VFJ61_04085 [Solirubrobacterales bacterium]|nr:hypothetical protein [Solirubrobacterales bacterium]